ncbi:MAG: N-acetylglucosamine-6-phosphate deacetylase [Acidobacteriota bacterium]
MSRNPPNSILLRGARIVAPDRVIDAGAILIESDRIAAVSDLEKTPAPKSDSVMDLDGLTLFPGFVDVHIHGAVGIDTMQTNAGELVRVSKFLASQGVTAWLPTLVPAKDEQYHDSVSAIEKAMPDAAGSGPESAPFSRILGVHYEGPFVNHDQCGALHREHFRAFKTAADLESLPRIHNPGAVHMMTVAPEIEGGIALIKELQQRGWVISIGHTRAQVPVLDQALQAGARHLTHFMNAMPPLHHRSPGPVGWGLTHDEVTCDVIADGVHLEPSILRLILRNKTSENISLISDAIAAAGLGDGEYQIWGERIRVEHGRTQNDRGSIAGSVITMLDAVRMMRSLNFSEVEVARMASHNPARLLGVAGECGSIEAGKRADLVALDQDGNVRLTIIGGRTAS